MIFASPLGALSMLATTIEPLVKSSPLPSFIVHHSRIWNRDMAARRRCARAHERADARGRRLI